MEQGIVLSHTYYYVGSNSAQHKLATNAQI